MRARQSSSARARSARRPVAGRGPAARERLGERGQRELGVAQHAERPVVPADLRRVDVDVHGAARRIGHGPVRRRHVAGLGAHQQHHVRLADRVVGDAPAAELAARVGAHDAAPPADALSSIAPLPSGVVATGASRSSATRSSSSHAPDESTPPPATMAGRAASPRTSDGLADGRGIRRGAQVREAAGARPEADGAGAAGREHVVRTAHERRARSTARGQHERPRRQLGDPLGAVQSHRPLGDRAKECEVIDFLDRISADGRGVHVVDHRHHGNR